jgi:hypothetical protein
MGKVIIVEVDVTLRTLLNNLSSKFGEDSKEYILVELDENDKQIGAVDYGYVTRIEAERIASRRAKVNSRLPK